MMPSVASRTSLPFFLMMRRPPRPTLFPHTPPLRSPHRQLDSYQHYQRAGCPSLSHGSVDRQRNDRLGRWFEHQRAKQPRQRQLDSSHPDHHAHTPPHTPSNTHSPRNDHSDGNSKSTPVTNTTG